MTKLDTTEYKRSHWKNPSRTTYGAWLLENADTGTVTEWQGTLKDAVRDLPAGTFKVLP